MSDNQPKLPPSIFNDVIGPVMRGPSSSHSAASVRIGRLVRALADDQPGQVEIAFDPQGSLATTHDSQGSDMGLYGGLMGWEADDERLPTSKEAVRKAGMKVDIVVKPIGAPHPNTYQFTFHDETREHTLTAISTGGGMIEVIDIDGFKLSLLGDYDVTLLYLNQKAEAGADWIRDHFDADRVLIHEGPKGYLIEVAGRGHVPEDLLAGMPTDVSLVRRLPLVLPVRSRRGMAVPFLNASEIEAMEGAGERPLWEHAVAYESARGGMAPGEVMDTMNRIIAIMRGGVAQGLKGTEYHDRVLGCQSGSFKACMEAGKLLDGGMLNRMILYVTALMEVKSSMGVIVAAPTAGSCATLPGALLAAADTLDSSDEALCRAMLCAGLIGVFVTVRSSFAAEVGGCQAETGAGAAMAAAALVDLTGGTTSQALSAASLALQNVLGLVCDPVANRVEAPCLGRNVAGAANALSSANMALAGYDHLIPFDQVLDAHREISASMPRSLRCTALGGLSITPASKAIEKRLCGGCSC